MMNSKTLADITTVFRDMCVCHLSEHNDPQCQLARENLQDSIKSRQIDIQDDSASRFKDKPTDDEDSLSEDDDPATIERDKVKKQTAINAFIMFMAIQYFNDISLKLVHMDEKDGFLTQS